MNKDTLWKVVLTALITLVVSGLGSWLTFASTSISRVDAEKMVDQRLAPTNDALRKMDGKQDQLQESLDDIRERLARIEERIRPRDQRSPSNDQEGH